MSALSDLLPQVADDPIFGVFLGWDQDAAPTVYLRVNLPDVESFVSISLLSGPNRVLLPEHTFHRNQTNYSTKA